MSTKTQTKSTSRPATLTIPELEQSKTAVLNTLASQHSRRSYEYAIGRSIAWYCGEPRLTFRRNPAHTRPMATSPLRRTDPISESALAMVPANWDPFFRMRQGIRALLQRHGGEVQSVSESLHPPTAWLYSTAQT